MSSQEQIPPLTEDEIDLLQKPIKEVQLLGRVPAALEALNRKHLINRTENEAVRAVERENARIRRSEEEARFRAAQGEDNAAA